MRQYLSVLFVATCVSCAHAAEIPPLTGPVIDSAGVLKEFEKTQMTTFLLAEEKTTTNQIVVLTVKTLGNDETIEEYAVKVFEKWKLGQKGKDNGVLIVVAVKDRTMRIEVGNGLEGVLTDAHCSQIIRNEITPKFKEEKFGEGLLAGVHAVDRSIKGAYALEQPAAAQGLSTAAVVLIILVVIIIVILLLMFLATNPDILDDLTSGSSSGGSSSGSSGGGYSGGGGISSGGGASGKW